MKRREFLKLVSASIALAVVPIAIGSEVEVFDPSDIEWLERTGDWSDAYAIGGKVTFNGKEYGYAVQMSVPKKDTMPEDIVKCKKVIVQCLETTIKRCNL